MSVDLEFPITVIFEFPITNTISGEHIVILSPSIEFDSQYDVDIFITHCKGKRSRAFHRLHNFFSYAHFYHIIVLLFFSFDSDSISFWFRCHAKFRLADNIGRLDTCPSIMKHGISLHFELGRRRMWWV